MKYRIILIVLFIFLGINSSCKKSGSALCGGDHPDKTLPWLKAKIETLSASQFCNSISRSTYKNQTVFIQANCSPNVDSINLFFDCDGTMLKLTAEEYQNLILTGPTELIWRSN
jgi:hypothetical protein